MKNFIRLLLLLSISINAQDDEIDPQDLVTFMEHVERENSFRADDPAKPRVVWTTPLIIDANNRDFDHSSVFKLEHDIVFKPSPNYVYPWIYTNYPAAIIVNKDNITIDLNGYNLSFEPNPTSNFMVNSATYGIAIYQGVKNLRITSSGKNDSNNQNHQGSITNFSGFAIYGGGSNQSYNSYDVYSLRIKNLIIENLLITQNINGIMLENALQPRISNTNIIYNYSPRVLYGIYFSNILNGVIENCNINQNWSYTDVFGAFLQDTSNMLVQNSQANVNRSLKNGNATGFWLGSSMLSIAESSANTIQNCIANRNLCSSLSGVQSTGFRITNLSHHNIISKCASFISGSTTNWPGQTPGTPQGVGFQLDSTDFNQISGNQAGYHITSGFYDSSAVSTSFFTANTGMFNLINYLVTVPNHLAAPGPLERVVLYANDVSAFTGSGPQLVNLDIQAS